MLALGPRLDPLSIFLVVDFDGIIGNHFAGAADGTVDGPHGAGPYRFTDKFDFQPCVAPLARALEQDVAFQLNLRGVI